MPVLSFRTGTFGGSGPLFGAWGSSDAREARRQVDICLEAGVNLFDTADAYSNGATERKLGDAIHGRRPEAIISTKTGLPPGDSPGIWRNSGSGLIEAVERSLRRLNTDYINILQLHALDAFLPVDAK